MKDSYRNHYIFETLRVMEFKEYERQLRSTHNNMNLMSFYH
jgi:hypothetical protein